MAHFNECFWRVEVPAGWQVLLVFVNFLIGQDGKNRNMLFLLLLEILLLGTKMRSSERKRVKEDLDIASRFSP